MLFNYRCPNLSPIALPWPTSLPQSIPLYCPLPWVLYICSLTRPFPLFLPFSFFPLLSSFLPSFLPSFPLYLSLSFPSSLPSCMPACLPRAGGEGRQMSETASGNLNKEDRRMHILKKIPFCTLYSQGLLKSEEDHQVKRTNFQ